jgi:hypothetical protein
MDDRTELLRTQAMQTCLTAMGAARVSVYGDDAVAGGVFLDDENRLTSTTYWTIDGRRYRYDVQVRVDVTRGPVGATGTRVG